MKSIKEKIKEAYSALKSEFDYKNAMQAPKIEKVIVSAGVGSFKDKKKIELAVDRVTRITGQKPVQKGAKQSVASFKVRDPVSTGITRAPSIFMRVTFNACRRTSSLPIYTSQANPK